MKKIFTIFILVFVAFLITGCDDNNDPIIEEDPEIYIVTSSVMVNVGEEKEVEYFADNLGEHVLEFIISDEDIFSFADNKVKGLSPGEASLEIRVKGLPDLGGFVSVHVLGSTSTTLNQIFSEIEGRIGHDLIEVKTFPSKSEFFPEAVISYTSSNPGLVSDRGLLFPNEYDTEATISVKIEYDGETKTFEHDVIVVGSIPKGYGEEFLNQFPNVINKDVVFSSFAGKYPGVTFTFFTSNESILSNTGKYEKLDSDSYITLFVEVEIAEKNYVREFSKRVQAKGLTVSEKAAIAKQNVIDQLGLKDVLDHDLQLPLSEERFGGVITWTSSDMSILNDEGELSLPLIDLNIELYGALKLGDVTTTFIIPLLVKGKDTDNKWDDIEEFIYTYLFKDEIETMKYTVMGVQPSYQAYNDGYVQFYTNDELAVIEDILPTSHAMRPNRAINLQYITIHDTANNGVGANAEMHNRFIKNENRTASSWHYTIDDIELYHHIPDNEVAWHAGTSDGNNTSIGIETCTNVGVDYDLVIRRVSKLVAKLLVDNNLAVNRVRQHFDWSSKNCPQVIRGSNRWNEVLKLIAIEYYGKKNLSDVSFEWESLSPTILDNTGKVFNHPGQATEVSYKVTVTYNGESKVFSHTSTLQAKK